MHKIMDMLQGFDYDMCEQELYHPFICFFFAAIIAYDITQQAPSLKLNQFYIIY